MVPKLFCLLSVSRSIHAGVNFHIICVNIFKLCKCTRLNIIHFGDKNVVVQYEIILKCFIVCYGKFVSCADVCDIYQNTDS